MVNDILYSGEVCFVMVPDRNGLMRVGFVVSQGFFHLKRGVYCRGAGPKRTQWRTFCHVSRPFTPRVSVLGDMPRLSRTDARAKLLLRGILMTPFPQHGRCYRKPQCESAFAEFYYCFTFKTSEQ